MLQKYEEPVDECDDKYVAGTEGGRPIECLRKAYKSSGCSREGKAHPDNAKLYTNDSGTKGIKTEDSRKLRREFDREKVFKYYQDLKSSANKTRRNPRADFEWQYMRMKCVMEINQKYHLKNLVGKILHHKYYLIKMPIYQMIKNINFR